MAKGKGPCVSVPLPLPLYMFIFLIPSTFLLVPPPSLILLDENL